MLSPSVSRYLELRWVAVILIREKAVMTRGIVCAGSCVRRGSGKQQSRVRPGLHLFWSIHHHSNNNSSMSEKDLSEKSVRTKCVNKQLYTHTLHRRARQTRRTFFTQSDQATKDKRPVCSMISPSHRQESYRRLGPSEVFTLRKAKKLHQCLHDL